ncbi:MAG: KH domain-containing protein [Candidatus Aminicenantes bacterium]|nr:KH domain-containing protein [Candidatus Aminicenantes bacterium]
MEAKKKRSVSKKSPDLDTGAEKAEQQPIEEQSEGEGEGKIIFCKYIKASIFVEKDNHRKIVIGRHGSLIKDIGTAARKELEDYLEMPVFLDLQVKVKKNWRDSADVLDLIEGQE